MGKKRSREEAKDVPPADAGADRMEEDSSDDEVRREKPFCSAQWKMR